MGNSLGGVIRRLIFTFALALVIAGCGESDKGKISSAQAGKLTKSVDRAEAAFQDGDCAEARTAAAAGADKVAALKGTVDDGLRQNLIDGFNHLEQELASGCDKPEKTATPEPTETATETPEPTVTETATPEPTDTPTPEPTDTATPEPTDTATPEPDTGGTDFDDGTGEVPSKKAPTA